MDTISALREQLGSTHWLLEETMEGVTPDSFHWRPSGTAESIADNYLHTVVGEDQTVHVMLGTGTPLFSGAWAGKSGMSSIPGGAHGSPDWAEWVQSVDVDLPQFRAYAKAVHAAADAYLASLQPGDLDRPVDLGGFGLGVQTTTWVIFNFIIGHVSCHTGEISAIKGFQDLKGYPF